MEVKIRGMNLNDVDVVAGIDRICFSLPWSKDTFTKELLNNLAYYQCATVDDKIVGYMGMWKICDEGHITNVAVLPEYRNRGIASLLIEKIIGVCKCSEINNLTLEVRESNYGAIRVYEKYGFKSAGIRPNYYHMPTENAIIMWKTV